MKAVVGDRLVIRGHKMGQPPREAIILEVRGPDGASPFKVKWLDDGQEGLLFPGPDAIVKHAASSKE